MGNSIGCSASGERLVSAARDGDFTEAKMLLDCNPCLAKYSTFGGLNSPLHFAAAKGHNEIVTLLLENGADLNSRNYSGQTALMQACRHGHWEVVQTLLIYRCNVTRADFLNGRTALHFASVNGHIRCIRLVVADFVPSAPFESLGTQTISDKSDCPYNNKTKALCKFVNKVADGGVTALHMAALNGHLDCVQLLLDFHANVSATTFNYGTSMDLIGAGSTPLHYAACGGNLKCCEILLARGASRLSLNCNGWLPIDVARMWGRYWLEPLLAPNSVSPLAIFPPSNYLALPLLSVLNIARESRLRLYADPSDDAADTCAVCLERACSVAALGCGHELCVKCALCLCSTINNIPSEPLSPPGSIPCPFCRHGIIHFTKSGKKGTRSPLLLGSCKEGMMKNSPDSISSDTFSPLGCSSSTSSVSIPTHACDEAGCPEFDLGNSQHHKESPPRRSRSDRGNMGGMRMEKITCPSVFWGKNRRSCSRENDECSNGINA